MAKALEVFVLYLLSEFLAHTFPVVGSCRSAGAVTAGSFKPFFDKTNHFLVGIEFDGHISASFLFKQA